MSDRNEVPDEKPKHGAGAEAAEGIHQANRGENDDDEERSGSEPLRHRDAEHKSGYGGEKAEPRK
jgi:hypothetical protein